MHEVSIMQEMARIVLEQAEAAGAEKVHLIRLKVGRLMAVVPEAMEFAQEVVFEGTIGEGAKLEIEHVPVRCWCPECEKEFECGKQLFLCPHCETFSRDVRGGKELDLVSMEVS